MESSFSSSQTNPNSPTSNSGRASPGYFTSRQNALARNTSEMNTPCLSRTISPPPTSAQNSTTCTSDMRDQPTSCNTTHTSEETSSDSSGDEVILSVYWKNNLLGAASYSLDNPIIYVVNDVADDRPMGFKTLQSLLIQIQPTHIVTSEGMPLSIINTLKELIAIDSDVTPPRTVVHVLPSVEYRHDNCMRRVLALRLPSKPKDWSDESHVHFLRTVVDFNAHCMVQALGGLLKFIDKNLSFFTGSNDQNPFLSIKTMSSADVVHVDHDTYRALGIFPEKKSSFSRWVGQNSCREKPTVFGLFDRCRSPLGSKFMKSMFLKPTKDLEVIAARQEVISFCTDVRNDEYIRSLQSNISQVKGVGSLIPKLQGLQANTVMWKTLHTTLQNILHIAELCGCSEKINFFSKMRLLVTSTDLATLTRIVGKIVDFDAPEGQYKFVVMPGIDENLDRMKKIHAELPTILNKVAEVEIEDLPEFVPQCIVTYYPEIGFLLTVQQWKDRMTKGEMQLPGYDYKFLSNGLIHYKSQRCKDLDEALGDPIIQIAEIQLVIMARLVEHVQPYVDTIIDVINMISELDCLISFATVAREHNYTKPKMTEEHKIHIVQGRHLLEEALTSSYVPNDVKSAADFGLVKIITGANNSGKTVYLKQTALIVFLAHLGSFVPAQRATIEVMDRICTRIRSSESTAQGTSAFMSDICQMQKAIFSVSPATLIAIDEFGRSTTASEGKALLAACLNSFLRRGPSGCPHVFTTTHFHCLRQLLVDTPLITDQKMDQMISAEGEITNLFRIVDGRVSCSMAVQAAVMADLPHSIIERVKELMSGNARPIVTDKPLQEDRRKAMVEALLAAPLETEEDVSTLIQEFREQKFL